MEWIGPSAEMGPSEARWKVEEENLVPAMTDKSSAPYVLLHMICRNCSGGCNTLRCTYRKHELGCTSVCGLAKMAIVII